MTRTLIAIALLSFTVPLPLVAQPQGPPLGDARIASRASQVNLPAAGNARVAAVSLALTPGAWTLMAKATAVNFGQADFVRCQLTGDGQALDGATVHVGTTNFVAGIVVAGGVSSGTPVAIALECWHDANRAGIYLDPGATIVATRVSAVNVLTLP